MATEHDPHAYARGFRNVAIKNLEAIENNIRVTENARDQLEAELASLRATHYAQTRNLALLPVPKDVDANDAPNRNTSLDGDLLETVSKSLQQVDTSEAA